MYATRCPECRVESSVPDRYVGKSWRCPACRSGFLVEKVVVDGREVAVDSLASGARPRREPASMPRGSPSMAAVRAQTVVMAGVLVALGAQAVPALALDDAPLLGVLCGSAVVALVALWRGCPCAVSGVTEILFAAAGGWLVSRDASATEVARIAAAGAGLGLIGAGGIAHAVIAMLARREQE